MERKEMDNIYAQYSIAFYIEGEGHTDVVNHYIALKPCTNPIFTRQYRIPESQKYEIQKQIDELERKGIIEKSDSAWNSPCLEFPPPCFWCRKKKARMELRNIEWL